MKRMLSLRLSEDLIEEIDREAETQNRTRTNMVEQVLLEWFRARKEKKAA